MTSNSLSILIISLLVSGPLFSQNNVKEDKDYFLFPIKPGQLNTLAGTMGEHRSTHFHTGIDIRTGGRIGVPVLAAADGYVSRIAVQAGGYGNALYITHTNNQITVYAHLDKFQDRIANHLRSEQYKRQKFQINLYPPRGQFPVKRGDTIAYSGNSGSSAGPHLHFDLRDANHKLLNPLQYNFSEVKDELAPVANRVALVTLDKEARVNGRFGRFEYRLARDGNEYSLEDTISVIGEIGVELYAYDRQNFTLFRTGISQLEMQLDGVGYYERNIETFSFSDQRNINVHVNYKRKQITGRRFEKLFVDDGNRLKIYTSRNSGRLFFSGRENHRLQVIMQDAYDNKSHLNLNLRSEVQPENIEVQRPSIRDWEVFGNVLKIMSSQKITANKSGKIYLKNQQVDLLPSYFLNDTTAIYLWDLRLGLPDSALVCNSKKSFNFKAMVLPGIEYKYYSKEIDLTVPTQALFDTLYFTGNYVANSDYDREHFVVHKDIDPLRRDISVVLKPNRSYNKEKAAVYQTNRLGKLFYVGGEWQGEFLEFSTRNFGTYTIAVDDIAPTIRPLIVNQDNLSFKIDDEMSGIDEFKLFIDGEWVLMNYEYKRKVIWSEKLDKSTPFEGELKLLVTDKVGNTNEYITTIR